MVTATHQSPVNRDVEILEQSGFKMRDANIGAGTFIKGSGAGIFLGSFLGVPQLGAILGPSALGMLRTSRGAQHNQDLLNLVNNARAYGAQSADGTISDADLAKYEQEFIKSRDNNGMSQSAAAMRRDVGVGAVGGLIGFTRGFLQGKASSAGAKFLGIVGALAGVALGIVAFPLLGPLALAIPLATGALGAIGGATGSKVVNGLFQGAVGAAGSGLLSRMAFGNKNNPELRSFSKAIRNAVKSGYTEKVIANAGASASQAQQNGQAQTTPASNTKVKRTRRQPGAASNPTATTPALNAQRAATAQQHLNEQQHQEKAHADAASHAPAQKPYDFSKLSPELSSFGDQFRKITEQVVIAHPSTTYLVSVPADGFPPEMQSRINKKADNMSSRLKDSEPKMGAVPQHFGGNTVSVDINGLRTASRDRGIR